MKINSIVIDDEPLAREGIADYLSRIPFVNYCGNYENPVEAMTPGLNEIDLIFLDIQMPVLTGLDFLSMLVSPPMIIITTAYPEYAVKGYELNALDYLLKPVSFERFLKACNKARDYFILKKDAGRPIEDYFFIKTDLRYEKIMLDEILYVEGLQNYVAIYTTAGKFITHATLKYLEETLPPDMFIRTHKSYIAAYKHIEHIEGALLKIADAQIPVSRDNKEEILQKILNGKLLK